MSVTIRECIIAALEHNGSRLVKKLHKRDVYTRNDLAGGFHFYIGYAGSMRSGRTYGASVPVNAKLKQLMINEGRSIIQERKEK